MTEAEELLLGKGDRFQALLPTGTSIESFLGVLATVPDVEHAPAPSAEEFQQMLAAMAPAAG
ncbi:MAG: hypothetical protein M3N32_10850 [Actinomycetota bacterium]|nr:hypothetical protein [Actinomycetota bacterium]